LDLNTPIKKIASQELVGVDSESSIKYILKVFQQEKVNAVLVLDQQDSKLGIFTENDYINLIALNSSIDLDETKVKEFMTLSPRFLDIEDPNRCCAKYFYNRSI
jgi:signal-transduction protein with cAMP-binding, CBS, and nucleotidyltransferase domain